MSEDFYCEQALSGKTQVDRVVETEDVLTFRHTRPRWRHHIVVVPKKHITSLIDLSPRDEPLLHELLRVVQEVAVLLNEQCGGCHVVTNVGMYRDSKHLHFHVGAGELL